MDEATSQRLLWLVCFYPVSYFYCLPLTESLFALLLCSSYLLLKRRKIFQAGFILSLAVLTRPTGILVLPPFIITLWLNSNLSLKNLFYLYLPSGLTLFALLTFFYFNTNDPIAFINNQVFWDRNGSILTLIEKFRLNPGTILTGWNFILLNFITLIVALLAIFHFIRKKEWDFAVFIFLPLAVVINTGSILSLTRLAMPLFPLFIYFARISVKPSIEKILLVIFAMLLAIMTLLFALHVTPAMA